MAVTIRLFAFREMKSPMWPGGAQQTRILVYGLR